MRNLFTIILYLFSTSLLSQKLQLELENYLVSYNHEDSSRYHSYSVIDTLQFNKNLQLDGPFICSQYYPYQPRLKGTFKENQLVDSLISWNIHKKTVLFRGYFDTIGSTLDTFRVKDYYGISHTFLGKAEGRFLKYNDDGSLWKEENYVNGKLNGKVDWYHNNKIWHTDNYFNGKKDGFQFNSFFDNNDSIFLKCMEFQIGGEYYESLKKSNIKGAHWIEEFKDGIKLKEIHYIPYSYTKRVQWIYKKEQTDSVILEWYMNGNLCSKTEYKNELKNGIVEYYFENGQLYYKGTYLRDSLEGDFIVYHENGKIAEKGSFHRGNIEKGYKKYNEKGKYIGSYSYYGNRKSYPPNVLDGAYIREEGPLELNKFELVPPVISIDSNFTRREKKLLKSITSFQIEIHSYNQIFVSDYEFVDHSRDDYGHIILSNEGLKLTNKQYSQLLDFIFYHFTVAEPLKLNENPCSAVINATVYVSLE